ncbi:putative C4-dicarboxylate transport system permease small protein [uncultured delta proteobacterium]|uniref:Putative C4-dicarboxylate transport system permease small protein n=1 Tax=uncultured delta proteobacterium TaxID=34034 RepID=A0A212JIS0_9DELT|nr:putative C4-dicarboxylate transport system permease small protein [uncultured delta proteobacterium]
MLKKLFNHFEEALGAVVMGVMVTLTFVNVVTRYVIVYPLAFTEEITISMFVWVTLLGVSIAFRSNAHLAVTFFYDLGSLRLRKIFYFVSTAMSIIFFALLTWLGTTQVLDEMALGVTTDSLAIPAWIYSAGIPVFSILVIIRIIQATAATVREGNY